MDLSMLRKTFLSLKSSSCSSATLRKYTEDLDYFLRVLPDELPDNPYLFFVNYLRDSGTRPVTIRSYCRSVRTFLRWAYESDLLPDYCKGIKLPKDDSSPKLPLYADEVAAIDKYLNNPRDYLMLHFMLDCGLRRQEVIHLQVQHVIFDKNVLHILDSKGNKSRYVLCPDFLLSYLSSYLRSSGISSGYIFRSSSGAPITENAVKMFFQHLKKSSGVQRVHAHLLRHTFATSYLLGGGNLEYLRVFLGHYDYSVTKCYSSMAAQMKMLGSDIYRLDPIWFTRGY